MITFTNIRNVDYNAYDEVWAIVRSIRPNGHFIQVQALSPSYSLFTEYRRLSAMGSWNKLAFDKIYVPRFLREMCGREARDKLNELYIKDLQGKNICAFCFCEDETTCHRSITAGLLQGIGCDVRGVLKDYSFYYQMWKELQNG